MADEVDPSRWTHTIDESVVVSRLCQRCSCLSLDDTADGFELREVDEDGDEDVGGPPFFWRSNPVLDFYKTEPKDEERDNFYREIRLDYQHSDQLPDLNGLRASAEAGCAFCRALRDAVLTLSPDTPGKVTLNLRYLWSPFPDRGLSYLSVNLDVRTEYRQSSNQILFSVSCQSGKHCSERLNVERTC
jgi:hypothetical protein